MFNTNYRTTHRTRRFKQIFPQENFDNPLIEDNSNFRWWYANCGLPMNIKSTPSTPSTDELKTVYILLLSKYGESHISYDSEELFKLSVMRIIFEYAPLWAKEIEVQKSVRELTQSDITAGSIIKNGHSYNPSTTVGIDSIGTSAAPINDLNMTKYEKSKLDGYTDLLNLLNRDVTEEFLSRFKSLFTKFAWEDPMIFWNCEEEEDEE